MSNCRLCQKRPHFGFENEKPSYCFDHKLDGMKNITCKKCKLCSKRPNFNYTSEKFGIYCFDHKLNGMINIMNKKCVVCDKQPLFNYPNEKTGLYCATHKLPEMIDVKHSRKCLKCDKNPNYNYSTEKIPIYCSKHKETGMVMITGKKCLNCSKQALFNYSIERVGLYCAIHKLDNMVNVKCKKCLKCDKQANFNYNTESIALYCNEHKMLNMINIKSRVCQECEKQPCYNFPNDKVAKYCYEHMKNGMVDVKHKQCIVCENTLAISKYKNHCFRCFCFSFPDEKIPRMYKQKENLFKQEIVKYLEETKIDIDYEIPIYDKAIQGGCSRRRPDCLIDVYTHSIVLECDEEQHQNYSCENKRECEIFQDLGNRPIVFVRFNPDKYKNENGNIVKSCFKFSKDLGKLSTTKEWNNRIKECLKLVEYHMNNIPEKEFTQEFLFYEIHSDFNLKSQAIL